MKIVLCDDEEYALRTYSKMLRIAAENCDIQVDITKYFSGNECIFKLERTFNEVDLIILDVEMGRALKDMDGIETARRLRQIGYDGTLVFLSSLRDYVFDAFDVEARQYLLKESITTAKFQKILMNAEARKKRRKDKILTAISRDEVRVIATDSIQYIEVYARVCTVYYEKNQVFSYYSSITKLLEQLAPQGFVQISKSCIVNMRFVKSLARGTVVLPEMKLAIGRKYLANVRVSFSNFLEDQI